MAFAPLIHRAKESLLLTGKRQSLSEFTLLSLIVAIIGGIQHKPVQHKR